MYGIRVDLSRQYIMLNSSSELAYSMHNHRRGYIETLQLSVLYIINLHNDNYTALFIYIHMYWSMTLIASSDCIYYNYNRISYIMYRGTAV